MTVSLTGETAALSSMPLRKLQRMASDRDIDTAGLDRQGIAVAITDWCRGQAKH